MGNRQTENNKCPCFEWLTTEEAAEGEGGKTLGQRRRVQELSQRGALMKVLKEARGAKLNHTDARPLGDSHFQQHKEKSFKGAGDFVWLNDLFISAFLDSNVKLEE